MSKLSKILLLVLGLPKTIYFNFKYLKLNDAIKFPFILSHRVVLLKCKGEVLIEAPIKTGMIKLGFGGVRIFDPVYTRFTWFLTGKMLFRGESDIGNGTNLAIQGDIIFGRNFTVSAHSQIICNKKITFGDNVLIGWDCLFMDSDAHKIKNIEGERVNEPNEILIGNRVWFGARCTVSKGTIISDDTVIATNSTVFGRHEMANCVIGGNPTRILKQNITWEI